MPMTRQYFHSFTIEVDDGKTSHDALEESQQMLFDWALKKVRSFEAVPDDTPDGFPDLRQFRKNSNCAFEGRQASSLQTASMQLNGTGVWGVRFAHEYSSRDGSSTGFGVAVETLLVCSGPTTLVCTIALYFDGHETLSPPGFVNELLLMGKRSYCSKCYDARFFDFVQSSLSHLHVDQPFLETSDELQDFLRSPGRKVSVILVHKRGIRSLEETNQLAFTKMLQRLSIELSGRALVFYLNGEAPAVFVYRPDSSALTFPIDQVAENRNDQWKKLIRNLRREYQVMPLLEDGGIETFDELLELSRETSDENETGMVPVHREPSSQNIVNMDFRLAIRRTSEAIRSLIEMLDLWNNESSSRK